MFDFHTHILPQVDDGSNSVKQSVDMLLELHRQQIQFVVATPHFDINEHNLHSFLKKRERAFQALSMETKNHPHLPQVLLGAEVVFYDGFFYMVEGLESLCIGNTNYMMVEFTSKELTASMLKGLNNLMISRGVIPIVAHVERYWSWRSTVKNIKLLTEMGILLQINAEFVNNPFTRKKALWLIKEGYIHALGSDCHNMGSRRPNIGLAYQHIRNKLGTETMKRIKQKGGNILKVQK